MLFNETREHVKHVMTAITTNSPTSPETVAVTAIEYNLDGDVVRGKVSNFAKRTYLGISGYSWQVRESGPNGLRTYYTWWLEKAVGQPTVWEAGTLTAYTVDGSMYGREFQVVKGTHPVVIEGLRLS